MKRATIILVILLCGLGGMVSADEEIGVFANTNTNCIQFINPLGQTVSPPFLKGQLGTYGGGLFDVVIAPNGKTAIVSNFGDRKIFFIDISGGFNAVPTLIGDGYVTFFAEDMDIIPPKTPNTKSKYVLVTDGGLSSVVAVMDYTQGKLVRRLSLRGRGAQAVAVTPDGELALFADYARRAIHSYNIGDDGNLTFRETQLVAPVSPVNIAISPDGKTVIVPCVGYSLAPYFLIDSQHNLCYKGFIKMPTKNGQSCVFSADSETAYYLSNSQNKGTVVNVLKVLPGKVTPFGNPIPVEPMRGTSQLFGVDTMAIDPNGENLYVTNPTVSGGIAAVSVINIKMTPTPMQVDLWRTVGIPTGIAFGTIKK